MVSGGESKNGRIVERVGLIVMTLIAVIGWTSTFTAKGNLSELQAIDIASQSRDELLSVKIDTLTDAIARTDENLSALTTAANLNTVSISGLQAVVIGQGVSIQDLKNNANK